MRRRWLSAAVLALVPLVLVACEPRDRSTVDRWFEPVVLTGAQVPALQGIAPDRLVAFRFLYGNWVQMPVQVDERAVLDLSKPKNGAPTGKTALFYTDPNTFTGADPDPMLDANDEIVFMARDMFGVARSIDDDEHDVHYTLDEPPGVVPGRGVQVQVHDPLAAGSAAWLYLFESNGTLLPGAGKPPLVDYDFVLLSGDYKTTYRTGNGTNPESSTVTTSRYSARFTDRWINDVIRVDAGNATNVDILDRQKSGFAGSCARTEGTFSAGGGAMIANKSGPVRAIRSYLGANSGTYTQRDHLMYDSRMDVVTHLRVHAIPPLRDWMDYSAAAIGMRYRASTNTTGVIVDGNPDSFPTAFPTWEMVSGAPGAVVYTGKVDTDIAGLTANLEQYYSDDSTPAEVQCTGDAFQYGASGSTVDQNVPNTDPTLSGGVSKFVTTRTMTFLEPNTTVAVAQHLGAQNAAPLAVTVTPFAPSPPDQSP
jgi:hypothetical protein